MATLRNRAAGTIGTDGSAARDRRPNGQNDHPRDDVGGGPSGIELDPAEAIAPPPSYRRRPPATRTRAAGFSLDRHAGKRKSGEIGQVGPCKRYTGGVGGPHGEFPQVFLKFRRVVVFEPVPGA